MKEIIAYALLTTLIIVYVIALFAVWEQRKKEKDDWNKYWDDVFEQNKNLNQ